MARKIYKKIDGEYRWIDLDTPSESVSAYVQGDTLETPLKHPVTGKIYDSKSAYLKDTKALGLEVVGNDKLSEMPARKRKDISDEKMMDAIQHAEAIHSDPAKRNEWRNKNAQMTERALELLHGKK